MSSTVDRFLTSLVGATDWNSQLTQIRAWAKAGRVGELMAIADAMRSQAKLQGSDVWVQQSIHNGVTRALAATPGFSEAEAALSLVMMPEPESWPPRRWSSTARWHAQAAEYLAQWQPPDVLLSLFKNHGQDAEYQELLACLVQEMTLRGYAIIGAALDFWQDSVINTRHPLGWLPTMLLPEEKMFPKYLLRYRTGWAYAGTEDKLVPLRLDPIEIGVQWKETEVSHEEKASLEAAVVNYTRHSCGRVESHVFRSDSVVPAESITPASVLALPLECLAETSADNLRLIPYSVTSALSSLFSAASHGGVYPSGFGVPYGRIEAWRSAGALAGADDNADIYEIASLVGRCAWFCIIAKSKWFYNIFGDLGLLALRPDRQTLAVLAATDTD